MSLVSARGGRVIRSMPALTRALDGEDGRFEAVVLRYNVRDDYNTEFAPGVFDASLAQRMPRIAWGHDWREMIGRWLEYSSDTEALRLVGQLDLAMIPGTSTPAVPLAHQAYAQLKSGTADQFSVGFIPEAWNDIAEGDDQYRRFTRGRLDEVSIVLAGAVPGTSLVAVRSIPLHVREPLVPKEQVAAIIVRLNQGEIDLADALSELKSMPATADTTDDAPDGALDEPVSDETPPAATETLDDQPDASEGDPEGSDAAPDGEVTDELAEGNGTEGNADTSDDDLDDLLSEAAAAAELVDAL